MTSGTNGQELVVVGVDGSAESLRALSWAARYATATGARVQAVLAWHYPAAAGQAPVGIAPDPVQRETEAEQLAILDKTIAQAYTGQPGPTAGPACRVAPFGRYRTRLAWPVYRVNGPLPGTPGGTDGPSDDHLGTSVPVGRRCAGLSLEVNE